MGVDLFWAPYYKQQFSLSSGRNKGVSRPECSSHTDTAWDAWANWSP